MTNHQVEARNKIELEKSIDVSLFRCQIRKGNERASCELILYSSYAEFVYLSMTLYQFSLLNKTQKAETLWENGVQIGWKAMLLL